MKPLRSFVTLLVIVLTLSACSDNQSDAGKDNAVPDRTKETFSLASLVDEFKEAPDSLIVQLNRQHHGLKVLERRTVPGPFTPPTMTSYLSMR
mgnify:CR=1 FL=1